MIQSRTQFSARVALACVFIALAGACSRDETPAQRLTDAMGKLGGRPAAGRLADQTYAPALRYTRGTAAARTIARSDAVTALGPILADHSFDARHTEAMAQLVSGNVSGAAKLLDALTREHPKDARYWNDLSGIRLDLGTREDDIEMILSALAAAECALRIEP